MTATITHAFVNAVPDDPAAALAGDTLPSHWNAAHSISGVISAANLPAAREILTADRNYYVRSDGSDSNAGLVNNAGGAFLTVQKAVDVVSGTLDLNNHDVTINVTGAVSENVVLKTCVGATATVDVNWGVPTGVKILGDRSSLVPFGAGSAIGSAIEGSISKSPWLIDGFKLASTNVGYGLIVSSGATPLYMGKVEFGTSTGVFHIIGDVRATESYAVSGNGFAHRFVGNSESLLVDSANYAPITVTVTNTPAFAAGFYMVDVGGVMTGNGVTFVGTATGNSMYANANGVIQTYGVGAGYCPGSGTVQTGGAQIL